MQRKTPPLFTHCIFFAWICWGLGEILSSGTPSQDCFVYSKNIFFANNLLQIHELGLVSGVSHDRQHARRDIPPRLAELSPEPNPLLPPSDRFCIFSVPHLRIPKEHCSGRAMSQKRTHPPVIPTGSSHILVSCWMLCSQICVCSGDGLA